MSYKAKHRVTLDYRHVGEQIVKNPSGIAVLGNWLWTVSDEGRTIECLHRDKSGYVLERQVAIDDLIDGIPGGDDELDLESIDVADGKLWLCGSHCRVRKVPKDGVPSHKLRDRPSRQVLAAVEIDPKTGQLEKGEALPFKGSGSLRRALADDGYLAPFLDLPSKENGLDIEGIAAARDGVLLGLRGPLVDSIAVVVHLKLGRELGIKGHRLSFLDLGGLAVRDLARVGDSVVVLAGPVSDAGGPYRLYEWQPHGTAGIEPTRELLSWPSNGEKPEGICAFEHGGKPGVLVVYDKPASKRLEGTLYAADWAPLPA